jgi:hypothetical protein
MNDEMKTWIDNASYESLLSRWRCAPAGSPWFQGEIGQYYKQVMFAKRDAVGGAEAVRASKAVGWDNRP